MAHRRRHKAPKAHHTGHKHRAKVHTGTAHVAHHKTAKVHKPKAAKKPGRTTRYLNTTY